MTYILKIHSAVFLLFLHMAICQECFLPRNRANCEECDAEGLDLSTGCTTCVSPLSIECEEGEQNCAVGNFVFSALFHSYQNPTHMCAECSDDRGPVTCESVGRGLQCGLRFIYCLQPYGSQSFDPPLVVQPRFGNDTDDETFEEDFFSQMNTGSQTLWNRSNPFTRNFTSWPGRTQFSIAVYSHAENAPEPRVVDRVLINLELSLSSSFTERRTYSGVNNFSHFDMSFKIEGNVRRSEDNARRSNAALIGGVVGGVLGGVLLLVVTALVVILILCRVLRKREKNKAVALQDTDNESKQQQEDQPSDTEKLPKEQVRQFKNLLYDDQDLKDTVYSDPAKQSSSAGAVKGHYYSVVQDPDRKFDNPIYGDELKGHGYSQTSHMMNTGPVAHQEVALPGQYSSLVTADSELRS